MFLTIDIAWRGDDEDRSDLGDTAAHEGNMLVQAGAVLTTQSTYAYRHFLMLEILTCIISLSASLAAIRASFEAVTFVRFTNLELHTKTITSVSGNVATRLLNARGISVPRTNWSCCATGSVAPHHRYSDKRASMDSLVCACHTGIKSSPSL